jgi:hypothetical protein
MVGIGLLLDCEEQISDVVSRALDWCQCAQSLRKRRGIMTVA